MHVPFLTYQVGKNKKFENIMLIKLKRKQTLSFNAGETG